MALSAAAILASRSPLRAAPSTGELRDDIAILRRALTLHPGLHRYLTPAQVERGLAGLEREYSTAPSRETRFLLLSRFLATVRCGHTHCNPYNQSDAVVTELFSRPTRMPFEFAWIDGRMIVTADRSDTGLLPRGTEITAIDGEPAARLLRRLLPYARADGGNDGKRVALMAVANVNQIETFDMFQGLLLPPKDGIFTIAYRRPDGREATARVAALTLKQRQATRHMIDTSGAKEPFWSWTMADGVATLTMPSWVTFNGTWDWKSWLTERLDSLKGARGLIIDLRDNEGGTECGNEILARLTPRDIVFDGYRELVRYRRTPPDLDRYLDTWDKSFRSIGEKGVDLGNGFFELGQEDTDTIPAKGPRLDLRVAALVGPTCSSATFSFARRAQESGLVRLFGEETGGNLRGINGGAYFFVTLPGSGFEFDVPLKGYFPSGPRPDRGVRPDVSVRPTAADIAAGRDPAMLAATDWLARGANG